MTMQFSEWIWQNARDKIGLIPEAAHCPYKANASSTCVASKARDFRAETYYAAGFRSQDEGEMASFSHFG